MGSTIQYIYMKLTDKQKKQIEKDLNGPPENFLLF